jgi:hypothetical protein
LSVEIAATIVAVHGVNYNWPYSGDLRGLGAKLRLLLAERAGAYRNNPRD